MNHRLLCATCFLVAATPAPAQAAPASRGRAEAFPHYELDIDLDPARRRLDGRCVLWIPAADEPRDGIKLGLGKNMRNLVAEVLEPQGSAGPLVLEPQSPIATNHVWTGRPARLFPAGRPVRLRLAWEGGEESSFVSFLGAEGSFLSGINTAWYPVLETGLGTGSLRIAVPAGLTVHATGLQRGSDDERARGVFRYECAAPSFFALAAAKYTVTRHDGAIPVSVYLLRPQPNVDEYVDGCRKCIEVLSQEFGPYPAGEFAIVEVPEAQAKKAGFTGASVAGFIMVTRTFVEQPFNLAYYGHEIGHQWWGNLIRRSGTRGRMMIDEAMAQYGSLRVVETLEGEDAAEEYRRTGYRGYYASQSGLGYLKVVAAGRDHPLSSIPDNASRSLSDGKGFQVWDMLSRTVGRDDFRRILRDFTDRHAFARVTWDELLQAIASGSGRDLQWFYDQWFERAGAPEWHLDWRQDGEAVHGKITQAPPYYRASLEVQAESPDGKKQSLMVDVDGAETAFTLPVGFAAQTVALDPRFRVLRWTPEYRAAVAQESAPRALSAAEQELVDAEQAVVDAVKRDDRKALRALLSDDFKQTGMLDWSRPAVEKDQWIDNVFRKYQRLQAPELGFSKTIVRVHAQTAVVNTLFTIRDTVDGSARVTSYALLDVWSKETGAWRLFARHLEEPPEK